MVALLLQLLIIPEDTLMPAMPPACDMETLTMPLTVQPVIVEPEFWPVIPPVRVTPSSVQLTVQPVIVDIELLPVIEPISDLPLINTSVIPRSAMVAPTTWPNRPRLFSAARLMLRLLIAYPFPLREP